MAAFTLKILRVPCALCALLLPLAASAASAVGEITMLLGGVTLTAQGGGTRPASVKGEVFAGDSVETGPAGHVHIRFADGGVVSVRPASRLVIEDYRQPDAATQKPAAIRFRLDQGVVRSITGRWGEADRERFRLNTPIAAIGIKGTDFIVHSSADSTRVTVNSGAIIAAPFGENCSRDALGPCQGVGSQQLSADMGRVMLELQRHQFAARILPRNGLPVDMPAVARVPEDNMGSAGSKPAHSPGDAMNETVAQRALAAPPPATAAEPAPAQETPVPVPEPLPPPPSPPPPPPPEPLVWGHWGHVVPRSGDTLSVSRDEAASHGRERVAENDYYALYRLPQAVGLPSAGVVSLGLASGQAHLVGRDFVLPAQVQGGHLTLNFASRQFNTGLTLNSALTGAVAMQSAGAIQPDGSFSSITISTRVKGAYAPDAGLAAYLFEHATAKGMLTGIANWR
jgi:hypothetical protein